MRGLPPSRETGACVIILCKIVRAGDLMKTPNTGKMEMNFSKREKWYIMLGISPFALFFFINLFIAPIFGPTRECFDEQYFKTMELKGIVKTKFLDYENHGCRTILVNGNNGINKIQIQDVIYNEIWDSVKVDDYIFKSTDSSVIIRRNNVSKTFVLNFACDHNESWIGRALERVYMH